MLKHMYKPYHPSTPISKPTSALLGSAPDNLSEVVIVKGIIRYNSKLCNMKFQRLFGN